jgi:hypothetical protein
VQVNVENRLSRVWPRIHYGSVTGLVDPLFLGNLSGNESEMSQARLVFGCHGVGRTEVLLRNDENVNGGLGIDVFEGKARVIFENNTRRKFLPDELAKQTVNHRVRSFDCEPLTG